MAESAGQLQRLRSSLSNWQDSSPGHDQLRANALALIGSGDLDAAGEVLKRGREAGWTNLAATCLEEAEYIAREAMIDEVLLRYCAASSKYGAAAALAAEEDRRAAWRFMMRRGARAL
jgi:hypothetical protein